MLGSNVSTVGGLPQAFRQATDWECECIQVYTTPSRQWEVPDLDDARVDEFFARWADSPVRAVLAHVPFLVNIASPIDVTWDRSRRRLVQEVRRAHCLRIEAVVLHPGSGGKGDRRAALARAATALRDVVVETSDCGVRILLENMAGQGGTLCARFEELSELLDAVGEPGRLGVCLDTAHAFMAGYPLVGYAGYATVLDEFDARVGCERIGAIHLNDSLTPQGSRHDRHAPAGRGQMGVTVFHALVRDERFRTTPMILEVPARDDESLPTLELLRRLQESAATLSDRDWDKDPTVQLDLLGS
jgi:deoxyribonuclease-4